MLKLCYQLLRTNGVRHRGFGRTLDMSSGGVRFEADDTFDGSDIRHGEIQLDMEWPVLLGQVCPLKLVMRGCIVRWDNRWVAVRLEQYEFRTAGAIARTPAVRNRERAVLGRSFVCHRQYGKAGIGQGAIEPNRAGATLRSGADSAPHRGDAI